MTDTPAVKTPGYIKYAMHSRILRSLALAGGLELAREYAPDSLKKATLDVFRQMSPRISKTEDQALKSGTVGQILSGIYKGQVDWEALNGRGSVELTPEEQAFLDGPVEELCRMADERAIAASSEKDLPDDIWQYIKDNKFLAMGIPKEYGGLEFSEWAHARVIQKLGSRSFSLAINVMVPNSLGPAKVVLQSGTEEQKKELLPMLARGDFLPWFGLTEPYAGSDATSVRTTGIVKKDQETGEIYIHIENDGAEDKILKRYITLAPLAYKYSSIGGLAIKIKDKDNLLGKGEEPGITAVLVRGTTPGIGLGRRHDPLGMAFSNGPVYAKPGGIRVSLDSVVGGVDGIGEGWPLFVSQLNVGRGISLPSVSVAGMQYAARVAGNYAVTREQFGTEIGALEENKLHLGEIAGLTYMSKAVWRSTLRTIDNHEKPAVETAIVKYHLAENLQKVVDEARQILAGKDVQQGGGNAGLEALSRGTQIARTVEGARNLGHGFIIPGQGMVRVHPQILDELAAAAQDDRKKAARDLWDIMTGDHLPNLMDNLRKVGKYATNNGAGSPVPDCDSGVRKYHEQVNRLSASFNVAANVALVGIGGNLKFKEVLGSYLGEVLSSLYIVSSALEEFERDGRPESDRPMLEWGCEHYLEKAEDALYDFIPNFRDFVPDVLAGIDRQTGAAVKKLEEKGKNGKSVEAIAARMKQVFSYLPDFLERELFPEGRQVRKPLNSKAFRAADVLLSPCEGRDRLLDGMFMPGSGNSNNVLHSFEDAFNKVAATRAARALVGRAMRKGHVNSADEAVEKGIINATQAEGLSAALKAVDRVVQVDDYPPEHFWRNDRMPGIRL